MPGSGLSSGGAHGGPWPRGDLGLQDGNRAWGQAGLGCGTVGSNPDTVRSNPDTVGSSPAVTLGFSPDKGGWMVLGQTGRCGHCWGLAGAPGPHWDWPCLGTTQGQRGDAGPHRESSTWPLPHVLPLKTNSFSLREGEARLLPCGLFLLCPAQTVPHPFPSHVLAVGNCGSVCCAGL